MALVEKERPLCPFCNTNETHEVKDCSTANDVVQLCTILTELKSNQVEGGSLRIVKVQLRLHELLGQEIEVNTNEPKIQSHVQQRKADSHLHKEQKKAHVVPKVQNNEANVDLPPPHIVVILFLSGIVLVYAKAGSEATFTAAIWLTVLLVVFYCNWLTSNARNKTLGKSSGLLDGLPKLD